VLGDVVTEVASAGTAPPPWSGDATATQVATDGHPGDVLYRVLGPIEVGHEGRTADLGPPKQRAFLAILLLNANQITPVDRIVDLLWPDGPPRHAAHAIQVYASELRKALDPIVGREAIVWQAPGYLLRVDRNALDATVVERLTTEGVRQLGAGDLAAAEVTLGQARELWRGPPLAEFTYEEFAQEAIRHLTDVWLEGTEALAEAKSDLGDEATALKLAEAAIREDPLRERPQEVRIRSLYRLDRAAEALRAYEQCRQHIADELGVEPSPALQRLHEAVLIHDHALDRVQPTLAAGPTPVSNPYKGLRAFTEADAADFHGREALVRAVLDALASGRRLITLVGPSGSGKSSALSAGLIPALRAARIPGSDRWVIAQVRADSGPLQALEAARGRAAADPDLVLVIDQLEDVFAAGSATECHQFLDDLTRAITDRASRLRAVSALRADVYDRPLQHAAFAEAFLPGIVNVVPMNAAELEAAIVEPARRVGVDVDPTLLAELVSDTIHRPGALPLLQHVLAELFDRRTEHGMTLAAYRDLGGLRGALSRRAEGTFMNLDPEQQLVARQVFLRLMKFDGSQHLLARGVPIRELTELVTDPVILSEVLRRLETNRLVTFDRDAVSGSAIVTVAHESLFTEWERLATWIVDGRTDLQRHEALAARVTAWEESGRHTEDLLAGSRLDECAQWARETNLGLTAGERGFVEASLEHRRIQDADREAHVARERRLERRARWRLLGLVGTAALLIAALAFVVVAWPGRAPDVVLVYPGAGDGGMYDSVGAGFGDAAKSMGLDAQTVVEPPDALRERLRRLAEQGVGLIVVGQAWSNPDVELVARAHPATRFLAVDYWGELPNVSAPKFAAEEGSFLAGAAAALKSRTGRIGVIADADTNIDWPYVGGFAAGAAAADPEIDVVVRYLPGETAHLTFATVNQAAHEMYRGSADVVFYAGRESPLGVFEAAYSESLTQGRQLWAIARDSDWYAALPVAGPLAGRETAAWRAHVLTSLVTRYDIGISTMLEDYAMGTLASGSRRFGLAQGAIELTTSGGFVADVQASLDRLRDQIVAGTIVVPRYPPDRGPPR
jgi:basic membrane lipoprotein Med (substrate-binding protein (PBP1-ABC) superfamily)/DNA-binding SARP family transcriptional activator